MGGFLFCSNFQVKSTFKHKITKQIDTAVAKSLVIFYN